MIAGDKFTIFLGMNGNPALQGLVERTQAEVVNISDRTQYKTTEIKNYIESHPTMKRYVILADCDKEQYEMDKGFQKHLVYVDAVKGLQMENLMEACAIMNLQ